MLIKVLVCNSIFNRGKLKTPDVVLCVFIHLVNLLYIVYSEVFYLILGDPYNNDPSTGSPMETLLQFVLSLDCQV